MANSRLKNQNVMKEILLFPHTESAQLNCKVKKWQPPIYFYMNPPFFQGYSPFLAKFLVPSR